MLLQQFDVSLLVKSWTAASRSVAVDVQPQMQLIFVKGDTGRLTVVEGASCSPAAGLE